MSEVLQWIAVGICLAGALGYLLYRLGLFELLGWLKKERGGHCSACPRCPTEQTVARLTERK